MVYRATLPFTLTSKNLDFSLFWTKNVPYDPPIWPQFRPIGCISKRPPIAPILFPVVSLKHYHAGFWLPAIFFSHIQCPGAVHSFWLFYYGGKGPYLGVFPILQYKRPQGEEVFFLGISNLGWFGFLKAQFWWHGILQRHRLPRSGLNSKRQGGAEVGIG